MRFGACLLASLPAGCRAPGGVFYVICSGAGTRIAWCLGYEVDHTRRKEAERRADLVPRDTQSPYPHRQGD